MKSNYHALHQFKSGSRFKNHFSEIINCDMLLTLTLLWKLILLRLKWGHWQRGRRKCEGANSCLTKWAARLIPLSALSLLSSPSHPETRGFKRVVFFLIIIFISS